MSELTALTNLKKSILQVDVPPQSCEILEKGKAGKDEPAAVVWVNAVTPKEFTELNEGVAAILQNGFRQNSSLKDQEEENRENKKLLRWAKKMIHHSEGFTPENLTYLLIPAQIEFDLEKSPDLAELFDDTGDGHLECDLGRRLEVAVLILSVSRGAAFHSPIEAVARDAAQVHAEKFRGKGSA